MEREGVGRKREGILILKLSESKADGFYAGGFILTCYTHALPQLNIAPVLEIIYKYDIKNKLYTKHKKKNTVYP